MNSLQSQGDSDNLQGNLTRKWPTLTDHDLHYAEGREKELIGRIQSHTGESLDAIEKALKHCYSSGY